MNYYGREYTGCVYPQYPVYQKSPHYYPSYPIASCGYPGFVSGQDRSIVSVIVEVNEEPLLRRYSLAKKTAAQLENHPYLSKIKQTYRDYIAKIKQQIVGIQEKNLFGTAYPGFSLLMDQKDIDKLEQLPFVKKVYIDNQRIGIRSNQQNLDQIQVPAARQLFDERGQLLDGKGITVAVLDSGMNLMIDPIDRYNFVAGNEDISDNQGHGTITTSVILDTAPAVSILSYKVIEAGVAIGIEAYIGAIERALLKGAQIINLSGGLLTDPFYNPDNPLIQAVENAVRHGVVVVVAVGNNGEDWKVLSPATSPYVIAVGATTPDGMQVAHYSNRGPVVGTWEIKPDILAPGEFLFNGKKLPGTSISTPYVSGAVALLLQKNTDWTPDDVKSALSTTATILMQEEQRISPAAQGSGRIDVLRAMNPGVTISPTHISFEPVKIGSTSVEMQNDLIIKNKSGQQREYDMRWEWDAAPQRIRGELGQSTISLFPGETYNLSVYSHIEPGAEGGLYSGKIVITSNEDIWHVPVIVMVEPTNYDFLSAELYQDTLQLQSAFENTQVQVIIYMPHGQVPRTSFVVGQKSRSFNFIRFINMTRLPFLPGEYVIVVIGQVTPPGKDYLVGTQMQFRVPVSF